MSARVDARVELLSIVCRLAGLPEFVAAPDSGYLRRVDAHFTAQSGHAAIRNLRGLAQQRSATSRPLDAWAVMSLALHLDSVESLRPRGRDAAPGVSDPWDDRSMLDSELLRHLRRFRDEARCEAFLRKERDYWRALERHIAGQWIDVDAHWLAMLLGIAPTEYYNAVLSLFGVADFGYFRVNHGGGRRETFTMLAIEAFGPEGMPVARDPEPIARMMLHESVHAFTNQLVDRNLPRLLPPAAALLEVPEVARRVQGSFYANPPFLLYESLVRAVGIVYLLRKRPFETTRAQEIAAQEAAGFLWIRGLVELLEAQLDRPGRQASVAAMMPAIVAYFDELARRGGHPSGGGGGGAQDGAGQ